MLKAFDIPVEECIVIIVPLFLKGQTVKIIIALSISVARPLLSVKNALVMMLTYDSVDFRPLDKYVSITH